MLIKHPARHYIHFLLSRRGSSIVEIIEKLDDLGMPLPQRRQDLEDWTQKIVKAQRLMLFPPVFDPMAEHPNAETVAFLQKWKIRDMWRGDRFVNLSIDLLSDSLVRRMIEALLLSPMSPASIAERIRERFGLDENVMNVRVIRTYAHYFWDPTSMNAVEWRNMIFTWMKNSHNHDLLAALNSPRSAAGVALTLSIVDRSADSLTPVAQYSAFRDLGFSMFMEHALLDRTPSLPRTQSALLAFQMVRMADEELTKHRGGTNDLLDEFRRIETDYDTAQIASVADLPRLSPPRTNVIDIKPVEVEDTE